jgi:hypothetical protein
MWQPAAHRPAGHGIWSWCLAHCAVVFAAQHFARLQLGFTCSVSVLLKTLLHGAAHYPVSSAASAGRLSMNPAGSAALRVQDSNLC